VLLLACAPVFAQSVVRCPVIALSVTAEPKLDTSAPNPSVFSAFRFHDARTDASAAQVQPVLFSALDTEPLASSTSFARPDPVISNTAAQPRLHWKPVVLQSARFLLVMHAFRLATEPSTRAELGGKFWDDYCDSVLGTGGWRDGDPKLVNYIGHPMEGAVSGFIFVQNDDQGRTAEFAIRSKPYWKSRLWASLYMTAFSVQFEIGPVSEASICNVGKVPRKDGGSYMGTVDLVVTPTLGLAWMVGEDMLDKYAVRGLERRTENRGVRALARGFLNPSRSFANMMRGKAPWYRDNRPISGSRIADRSPAAGHSGD